MSGAPAGEHALHERAHAQLARDAERLVLEDRTPCRGRSTAACREAPRRTRMPPRRTRGGSRRDRRRGARPRSGSWRRRSFRRWWKGAPSSRSIARGKRKTAVPRCGSRAAWSASAACRSVDWTAISACPIVAAIARPGAIRGIESTPAVIASAAFRPWSEPLMRLTSGITEPEKMLWANRPGGAARVTSCSRSM